mmetsp:Transcript_12688/g.20514  ORF Transcript_12688/g.20514 Transcript_12688/m.20514 type:complete len:298 (-) Transcript_12688:974-1867(-)
MDTTGIDVPNSRAIAKQLLTLSQDPDNQPFIVQEQGCLAGLVQYTQHQDIDVVLMATRALQFLSSHPQNKSVMRDFPGLVGNLTTALSRSNEHPKIDDFVRGSLRNLSVEIPNEEDTENLGDSYNLSSDPAHTKKKNKTLGSYRTITLSVFGVSEYETRQLVEKSCIRVTGVISVTINPEKDYVLVGTREIGDDIVRALTRAIAENAEKTAKVVVNAAPEGSYDGDSDCPEYLEEEDYDEDEDDGGTRITRQGFSSLEGRLEQQRKDEEARKLEKSSRLLGKVSNALSNASSWLLGY